MNVHVIKSSGVCKLDFSGKVALLGVAALMVLFAFFKVYVERQDTQQLDDRTYAQRIAAEIDVYGPLEIRCLARDQIERTVEYLVLERRQQARITYQAARPGTIKAAAIAILLEDARRRGVNCSRSAFVLTPF